MGKVKVFNVSQYPADLRRRYGLVFTRAMVIVLRWEQELSSQDGEVICIWGVSKRWHLQEFYRLFVRSGEDRLREAINWYARTLWQEILRLTPFEGEQVFLFDTAVDLGLPLAQRLNEPSAILSVLALRRLRFLTQAATTQEKRASLPQKLNHVFALLDELDIKD